MTIDEVFEFGYISKVHGYKGELILQFDVDNIAPYKDLELIYLQKNRRLIPFFIKAIKFKSNVEAIFSLEDIFDAQEAEPLVGNTVYLPIKFLPDLGPDKYYYHELTGMEVQDINLGKIGIVLNTYETPMQFLLEIDHQGKEVLVPLNDDIVKKVDKDLKIITTHLPDGLLDVYLES
jgi:16S rRNA processing protein RimM